MWCEIPKCTTTEGYESLGIKMDNNYRVDTLEWIIIITIMNNRVWVCLCISKYFPGFTVTDFHSLFTREVQNGRPDTD